jgi:hypothetical protein
MYLQHSNKEIKGKNFSLPFSFFSLCCCDGWGYIVALYRFLHFIKYIIYEFTSSTILLHSPLPW